MHKRSVALLAVVILLTVLVIGGLTSTNRHAVPGPEDTARPLADSPHFAVSTAAYASTTEFEHVLRALSTQKIPLVFLVGTVHGITPRNIAQYEKTYNLRLVAPASGAYTGYTERDGYRSYYLPGAKVLLVDASERADSRGTQLEAIRNEVARDTAEPLMVIVYHAMWGAAQADLVETLHPLLAARGKTTVFSGVPGVFAKDGVQYLSYGSTEPPQAGQSTATGLSYTVCTLGEQLKCTGAQAAAAEPTKPTVTDYSALFGTTLTALAAEQPVLAFTTGFRSDYGVNSLRHISYITLEKTADCSFPLGHLQLTGSGFFEPSKYFTHLDVSDLQRIYLIDNKSESGDAIQSIQFSRLLDDPADCKAFQVKVFNRSFTWALAGYRAPVDSYRIALDKADLATLKTALPDSVEERTAASFNFPSVSGNLTVDNKTYGIKIKNRGLSLAHWAYAKKSYTLKFKDYFKHNQTLLAYIPDKRAYTGEYLVNRLADILNVPALDASFKEVIINGKSYGTYYISEDFDNLFLAKRGLPEANIYTTDPYQAPAYIASASFNVLDMPKSMIVSTLKNYEKNYDRDADYFLSVIKLDTQTLAKNWRYYFDSDNLAGMLALMQITGTAHYDFHNVVFYINPDTGKIHFFPWDLMNYTHVGDLQRADLKAINNDYIHVNELFTKLLEISEIRLLRNRLLYSSATELLEYVQSFGKQDNIRLMATFFTDPTVEFPEGEGNRPALVTFLRTPHIISTNITYLQGKIAEMNLQSEALTDGTAVLLNLTTHSYGENTLNRIVLNGSLDSSVGMISVNGLRLAEAEYSVEKTKAGLVINFQTGVGVSPILEYKSVYASPVLVKPATVSVRIDGIHQAYGQVDVELVNPATGAHKTLQTQLMYGQTYTAPPAAASFSDPHFAADTHPAVQTTDGGKTYTFKNLETVLESDLVLAKNSVLKIQPGSTIKLGEGVSLVSYGDILAKGTKEQPIVFTGTSKAKPWGVVAVLQEGSRLELDHCKIQGGSSAFHNGAYFSGMVSAYVADTFVTNSEFTGASRTSGDDALNVKQGFVYLTGNVFKDNLADAVDLDFIKRGSLVRDNTFQNNANDHIDLSGSQMVLIKNNQMNQAGDKGISVGEGSDVVIQQATIANARYGIVSKDASFVTIKDSTVKDTKVGVASYNKKEVFGGSRAYVYTTTFVANTQDFGLEFIELKDWRFGDPFYRSYIYASSSTYRLTGRTTTEVIIESLEPPKTKKELYEKASKNTIDAQGSVYAKLTDSITN
jgi:hypothetical protein